MSSTLTNVIVALGTLTIVVVACMTWVRRKQRDLDELVSALRSFNSLGYNLRLDDGLEERLHTGLNRALTGMGRRHEIAERRKRLLPPRKVHGYPENCTFHCVFPGFYRFQGYLCTQ